MFKGIRKPVSNKEALAYIYILRKIKKFLALIGILGMVWSYIPWDAIYAETKALDNQNNETNVLSKNSNSNAYQLDESFDLSKVPVVTEDVSKRNASEKYFKKLDGTYEVALYEDIIHFFENGEWHQVNNSLIDNGESFENKANKFKINFPKKLDDNKSIKLKMNQYKIDWSILNIDTSAIQVDNDKEQSNNIKELNNIYQSVFYPSIQQNVDIEYIISGAQVKENIILNEYIEDFSMTFEYKLNDLELVEQNGRMIFINDIGEEIFVFSDLFMIDDNMNESYDVDFSYVKTGTKEYEITIKPNDEWLKNAEYPVKIDPTIDSYNKSMSIYDTYVSEANPTSTYSGSSYLRMSNTASNAEYRGLLYFLLPSTVMDKVITYAKLEFTKLNVSTGAQINAYKNTETFTSSSATWENKPSYNSTVVDYYTVDSSTDFIYDITQPVKEWQATGNTRTTGFTFKLDENYGSYNAVYQMGASSSLRPRISIGYEEPAGLKDYWTYTSQDMGLIGTGYISDYTGNLTWVRNEYSLDNEFLSMNLNFYYNIFDRSTNIGYGDGWKTNYDMQIVEDNTTGLTKYYLSKPDGNKVYFMNKECNNIYSYVDECSAIAEDGSRMVLDWIDSNGSTSNFTVTTTNDIKYLFDGENKLTQVTNTKTNYSIDITYQSSGLSGVDSVINYINDEAGNIIDFSYGDDNYLNITKLKLIQEDSSFRVVEEHEYKYDMYNNLDSITQRYRYGTGIYEHDTFVTANKLEYMFNSDNVFQNAYQINDGFRVDYEYDTQKRVNKIEISDVGGEISNTTVSYQTNRTIYTDYEGNKVYYTFDNYGHTINIIDSFGNSSFYRYAGLFSKIYNPNTMENNYSTSDYYFDYANMLPNYYINHALLESSDLIKQQQNPLNNHSFEEGSTGSGWNTNGSVTFVTDESVLGGKSAKLYSSSYKANMTQDIYLEAGGYTIQAWIMQENGSPGAYIDVIGEDSVGTINKVYSSDGWEKYELTFMLTSPKTVTVKLINDTSYSAAYFDNIQLIEGFSDTRYNIVSNNSFESGTNNWSTYGFYSSTNYETEVFDDILGEKSLRAYGDGASLDSFTQNIQDNNSTAETYIVGGWGKSNTVPNKTYASQYPDGSDGRFFGIIIEVDVDPADGSPSYSKQYYLTFNTSYENWQYQMVTFTVPAGITDINVTGAFRGEGYAYFDNIQVYQDNLFTVYDYDTDTGDLITITNPDGTNSNYEYNCNNNVTRVDQDGVVTDIERNNTCLVEEVIKNNVRTTYVYGSSKNQLTDVYVGYDKDSSTQDKWFKTSTTYTTDNQYVKTYKDEFGNVTTTTVDYSVGLISEILDAVGNSQEFIYDEQGRLKTTTQSEHDSSGTISSSYEYNIQGRLTTITRDNFSYTLNYNDFDQLESVSINSTEIMSYEYWEDTVSSETYHTNNLKKQTYGNNDYVEFTYTDENQIQTVSFNGVIRYEYDYDASGRLSILKDIHNSNIYFYSYDLVGKLEKITDKDGNTIEYTYDKLGNINGYEYSIGTVSRGVNYYYDELTGKYLYTEYQVGSNTVTKDYNYDSDSLQRLSSIELSVASLYLNKTFHYDDGNVDASMGNATSRISYIEYDYNGAIKTYHYTYDANQNITRIQVKDSSNNILDQYDYHYDGFNQLIREDIRINLNDVKTVTYSYDNHGNIKGIYNYNYVSPSSSTLPQPSSFMTYTYSSTWDDQVRSIKYYENFSLIYTETFSYDTNGNLTSIDDSRSYYNDTFQWDGRQMTSYGSYCFGYGYKYNDQGIRTKKSYGSCGGSWDIEYTLDGDKVLVEEHSDGTVLHFTYDVDGSLLSMNYNGNEYFYVTNMQGDVTELLDINGNIVVVYKYDAWGNIIYQSGGDLADLNPYRYRGYRYDNETGWYYLQSRYYNPKIGRFISSDGLLGKQGNPLGHNMYAYTYNNPVMLTDSTGYAPEWFNNIKDSIVDWLTTVPDREETFQNKTGLLVMTGSVILGTGIGIGANFMNSIARNITPIRGNPRIGMSKFLKGVGITITVFATARTVGNLWFADNSFTNAERLSLISVEIAGAIAVTLAVSMLSAAVVAAGIISTPVLVAGVAVVAIGAAIYYGTDALYNYCETN